MWSYKLVLASTIVAAGVEHSKADVYISKHNVDVFSSGNVDVYSFRHNVDVYSSRHNIDVYSSRHNVDFTDLDNMKRSSFGRRCHAAKTALFFLVVCRQFRLTEPANCTSGYLVAAKKTSEIDDISSAHQRRPTIFDVLMATWISDGSKSHNDGVWNLNEKLGSLDASWKGRPTEVEDRSHKPEIKFEANRRTMPSAGEAKDHDVFDQREVRDDSTLRIDEGRAMTGSGSSVGSTKKTENLSPAAATDDRRKSDGQVRPGFNPTGW